MLKEMHTVHASFYDRWVRGKECFLALIGSVWNLRRRAGRG